MYCTDFSNSLSPVYFKPMNVIANCVYAIECYPAELKNRIE